MLYLKLLETFILRVLFTKDEYNFKSKNFSPLKVTMIAFLLFCTSGFFVMIHQTSHAYSVIESTCPGTIEKLTKKKHEPVK